MAAGLPVVATRVGGIPEMIDADTGILVEPRDPPGLADAVVDIAADPSKARQMGAVGHQVAADRFDIRKQAKRLVAEYHSLVNPRTLP
jgi:glycosyltransferase involved in cell wall biosynthesis